MQPQTKFISNSKITISVLTEREREVLCLIAQGSTSKEIGKTLGISSKTAEAHRNNIKKKLRANTIAELVQCAIVFNLIVPRCPE
jgi:two-component system nitrate/nitrite response regulator NarL